MNNTIINHFKARHERILQELIECSNIPAPRIKNAMLYALFPGGKRLRPTLVYLCGSLIDVNLQALDAIAVAIELTHCYSLIHDDLPAMDDDDLRRGKPSCHREFDEATAILVGDGMQALAVDILLTHLPHSISAPQVIAVTHELVKACGPSGMVSGQSLDLTELSNPTIKETQLCEIHGLKTGKLITACINMTLAAGLPSEETVSALRDFARHFGLVFQMQDDYLDHYGQLGKGRASDSVNHKTTFANLYEKEQLSKLIAQHFDQAKHALAIFGSKGNALHALLNDLQQRT